MGGVVVMSSCLATGDGKGKGQTGEREGCGCAACHSACAMGVYRDLDVA